MILFVASDNDVRWRWNDARVYTVYGNSIQYNKQCDRHCNTIWKQQQQSRWQATGPSPTARAHAYIAWQQQQQHNGQSFAELQNVPLNLFTIPVCLHRVDTGHQFLLLFAAASCMWTTQDFYIFRNHVFTRSFSSMVAGASFFLFLFFVVIRIHSGAPGEGLVWMVVVVGMMKNIKRHWFDVAHRSVQGFTEQKRASFSVLSGFSWNFFTATEYKNRKKNNKTKHIRRWVISSEYSKPQSTERTKKIIYNSIITPHEGEPATDVTLSSSIQQH